MSFLPPGPERLTLRARRIRFPADVAGALSFLMFLFIVAAGCGDDDDRADTGASADARIAAAAVSGAWRLVEPSLLAHGSAFEGRTRVPSTPDRNHLVPRHEFDLECPDVSINLAAGSVTVFVVYGVAGCTSELTGEFHRGHLRLTLDLAAAPAVTGVLDLVDYTTGEYRIDGTIGATIADSSWIFDAARVVVAGPDDSTAVTACLGMTWRDAGTRTNATDDSWVIRGFASVEDPTRFGDVPPTYLEIDPDAPLLALATCAWPVAGRLEVRAEGRPAATVDFGDGACDDEVLVTVGGRTVPVSLSASSSGLPIARSLPSKP